MQGSQKGRVPFRGDALSQYRGNYLVYRDGFVLESGSDTASLVIASSGTVSVRVFTSTRQLDNASDFVTCCEEMLCVQSQNGESFALEFLDLQTCTSAQFALQSAGFQTQRLDANLFLNDQVSVASVIEALMESKPAELEGLITEVRCALQVVRRRSQAESIVI